MQTTNVLWTNINNFNEDIYINNHFEIEKVKKFRKIADKIRFLTGRKLLQFALKKENLDLNLEELCYTKSKKPFFNSDFSFNLSHSQNIVLLVYGYNFKVGCDVEFVDPLKSKIDYETVYSKKECEFLNHSKKNNTDFFNLWSRKEALLKAMGIGFLKNPANYSVLNDSINIDNDIFFIKNIHLNDEYSSAISSSKWIENFVIQKVEYQKLISDIAF